MHSYVIQTSRGEIPTVHAGDAASCPVHSCQAEAAMNNGSVHELLHETDRFHVTVWGMDGVLKARSFEHAAEVALLLLKGGCGVRIGGVEYVINHSRGADKIRPR